jgi:hypothetical protein
VRATTDYIQNWLTGLSERTKDNYLKDFKLWLKFIKLNPEEQIKKRMENLTSQDLTERTYFEKQFRAFKEYLEQNTNLKPLSVKTKLRTVASFFSRNSLPLNLKRGDWESTQTTEVKHRFKLEQKDVKAMYAHANLRDRIVLLGLAQSGFSEIDLSVLKIEDIKDLYNLPQAEHYFIEKPREKTNIMQATCLSYEFLHDLRAYLAEQNNPTEGYIFTSQTRNTENKPIEIRRINNAMKTLAQKALGTERAKEFKTKALRSFYNSALLRANLTQEIKDLMMGHGRKGARSHYSYDEYTIREAYKTAFDYLSINGIQARNDIAEMKNSFTVTLNQLTATLAEVNERNAKLEAELKSLGVDISTIKKTQINQQKEITALKKKTEDPENRKLGKEFH